jgi:hypothetical protein
MLPTQLLSFDRLARCAQVEGEPEILGEVGGIVGHQATF